jgi:hypothetical protein
VKLSGRAWVAIAAVLTAAGVGLGIYQRARIFAASPAGMLQRLPPHNAITLFLDFDALRQGGILKLVSPSKATEEPEYQAFVRATGFDYRHDLDLAAASFSNDGEFFVIKGRFDWKKLGAYAVAQGGACEGRLCRMPGSTPQRRISFFPVQSNLMALAVSGDSIAATRLADTQAAALAVQSLDPPRDPVWLSIPVDSLKTTDRLPPGTRLFATALASADKILLSLGPQGQQLEAKLAVTCRTSADAAALAAQLQRVTALLREMIAHENQKPDPKDLSGVLTAGVFQQAGRRVTGRWPLPPAFLESLAGGAL